MARDVYMLRLNGRRRTETIDEHRAKADLYKLMAMGVNKRVTDNALLSFGSVGYYREMTTQWYYRYTRPIWLVEGTSLIQQITAAKNLLHSDYPYDLDEQSVHRYELSPYEYKTENGDGCKLYYEKRL